MAETTTTTSFPRFWVARQRRATFLIRSTSATEVPPNFWTISAMSCEGPAPFETGPSNDAERAWPSSDRPGVHLEVLGPGLGHLGELGGHGGVGCHHLAAGHGAARLGGGRGGGRGIVGESGERKATGENSEDVAHWTSPFG